MDITKVRIRRKSVSVSFTNEGEAHTLSSSDMPLPSFIKSVEALAPTILDILGLPTGYIHGLRPTGITLVDKQDTQLVCLTATKELTDCNSPFNIATPLRFLSLPQEEGNYSPPLPAKTVELIDEVVKQAKKYVKGDRAQGQLPLQPEAKDGDEDDEKEADDPKQTQIAGTEPAATGKVVKMPKAKKPRKPRA